MEIWTDIKRDGHKDRETVLQTERQSYIYTVGQTVGKIWSNRWKNGQTDIQTDGCTD